MHAMEHAFHRRMEDVGAEGASESDGD
jgi:hypothetical protein